MLKSMTGFGRGRSVKNGLEITVEMRSVNHRYADLSLRLPRELSLFEGPARQFLKQKIERGRLEVSVTLADPPPGTRAVKADLQLAEELCRTLSLLCGRLSLNLDINTLFTALLPEIIQLQYTATADEGIWALLEECLQEALDKLIGERDREGTTLYRDLTERCRRLEELVEQIASRAPVVYEEYALRLKKKLREALDPLPMDENRVLTEWALLVERAGIDEEVVRLRSHLHAFRETLHEEGAVGRKLDFIAQEMFRESNTIGAKSIDFQLTALVVEFKAELEKIREQIQNIE